MAKNQRIRILRQHIGKGTFWHLLQIRYSEQGVDPESSALSIAKRDQVRISSINWSSIVIHRLVFVEMINVLWFQFRVVPAFRADVL